MWKSSSRTWSGCCGRARRTSTVAFLRPLPQQNHQSQGGSNAWCCRDILDLVFPFLSLPLSPTPPRRYRDLTSFLFSITCCVLMIPLRFPFATSLLLCRTVCRSPIVLPLTLGLYCFCTSSGPRYASPVTHPCERDPKPPSAFPCVIIFGPGHRTSQSQARICITPTCSSFLPGIWISSMSSDDQRPFAFPLGSQALWTGHMSLCSPLHFAGGVCNPPTSGRPRFSTYVVW